MKITHHFLAIPLLLSSASALAITSTGTCSTSNMTMTSIVQTQDGSNSWSGTQGSSTCLGIYTDPNNYSGGGTTDPVPNLGIYREGLLNGDPGNYTGGLLSDADVDYLLTADGTGLSTRENIDDTDNSGGTSGYGLEDDPGYIHLLSGGENLGQDGNISYDSVAGYNLADFLNFSFSAGTLVDEELGIYAYDWSLEVLPGTVEFFNDVLGRTTFDHLAFSFKQATEWVIYDFDFSLVLAGLVDLDGLMLYDDEEYIFSGVYYQTYADFGLNAGSISHFDVWARDPPVGGVPIDPYDREVPEPATLWLFGLGLLGLAGVRRLKLV